MMVAAEKDRLRDEVHQVRDVCLVDRQEAV